MLAQNVLKMDPCSAAFEVTLLLLQEIERKICRVNIFIAQNQRTFCRNALVWKNLHSNFMSTKTYSTLRGLGKCVLLIFFPP